MNGQEKDDEIFVGAYTAEYWEYDSRIGRRWNTDPIVKPWESPYACFANNPIWFSDVKGDDATETGDKGKGKTPKVDNTPDPVKKPGEGWAEVEVTAKRTGFWEKVGNFFKDIGNSIANLFRSADKGVDNFTDKVNNTNIGKKLQQFERDRGLEHDDHPTKSRNKDEIQGEGKLSPGNTQEESKPVFPFSGPTSTYDDPTDPNNRPDKKQSALIKKQNDSTILRNVRNSKDGTLIDIKIPDDVPQGEDTKGIIINGKNKGKGFIYIDNPPLNK